MTTSTEPSGDIGTGTASSATFPYTYDKWLNSLDIPIYRGYYIQDLRTLELGWWKEAGRHMAAIILSGQEGIADARLTEIPPAGTLPPLQLAFDEVVYVVEGRGSATVKDPTTGQSTSFEWGTNSMFLLARHMVHQLHNTQGEKPVRLLHYSYLPLSMSGVPDPEFFFNNGYKGRERNLKEAYAEAEPHHDPEGKMWGGRKDAWRGNFFPDMSSWDKLEPNRRRGAGGHSVYIEFPESELTCHMSQFAPRLYKKGHRHGPGRVIVIPAGEGYSIMWEEGHEKVVVPWQKGSMVVPPNRWFHQHFNLGATPARYLALHPPMQFYGYSEHVEDMAKDQIEYHMEEPEIRERFEGELAKRGLTSLMPDEVYRDASYNWYAGSSKE